MFDKFMKNTDANLMDLGIELTGFMVVVGVVLMPIGYSAIATLNKTAIGVVPGSTQDTVLSSVLTISLAVIVLALIARVKN